MCWKIDKTIYMLNSIDYTEYTASVQLKDSNQAKQLLVTIIQQHITRNLNNSCQNTFYPRATVNVDGFWLRYRPITTLS